MKREIGLFEESTYITSAKSVDEVNSSPLGEDLDQLDCRDGFWKRAFHRDCTRTKFGDLDALVCQDETPQEALLSINPPLDIGFKEMRPGHGVPCINH